ncbi:hypothetical protein G7046_g3836 [Stylonectria norvegica]|nr:hypothetical protein G7046_g3836 [Stylonectria norvegica]
MPRKRDPNAPASRRSHHGCNRCRLHKIRCDEAKPSCGRCTSRGYTDCVFVKALRWETDYTGRAFGRAGVWSKDGKSKKKLQTASPLLVEDHWALLPRVHPFGFLNIFTSDFEDDKGSESLQPGSQNIGTLVVHSDYLGSPQWQFGDSRLDNLTETYLLSYYLHRICPLTVPCANSQSPFSALILPFALTSSTPAILHALLGVAASHRARFDKTYQPVALKYAGMVMQSLQLSLNSKTSLGIAMDPEIMVLVLLLCQLEITRGCDKRWVVHLRGARDLVRFRRRQLSLNSVDTVARQQKPWADIITFSERYFAFCDVMGRTACGEEPIFGNEFWTTQEDQLDLWMGCSPHLVSIISDITELSWKYHREFPAPATTDGWQELDSQKARLSAVLRQPNLNYDSTVDDILQSCVELKRLTVELYFHSALSDTTPSTPVVHQSVQRILRLVFILLKSGVKAGMTWPLFMAACQLGPDEELEWATEDLCVGDISRYARPFVLYALDQLSDSLSNVARTRDVIEKVWKQREAAFFMASERKLGLVPKAFNDWARFVAPFCHNISLV